MPVLYRGSAVPKGQIFLLWMRKGNGLLKEVAVFLRRIAAAAVRRRKNYDAIKKATNCIVNRVRR